MALIVSPKQLARRAELYHQLSMLVVSGIPLITALEMMERNPAASSVGVSVAAVTQALREGRTVTDAFRDVGGVPEFDAALIEAGDKSGRLDQCFKLLSLYYTERSETLRTILGGLVYPVFLVHMAAVIFPFVAWVQHNNTTKFIATVLGILVPIYLVTGFIIYACQGRRGETWRAKIEKVAAPIPFVGLARKQLALARLAAALEALLNAGVPIIGAWELAAAATGSPSLHRTVNGWRKDLEQGSTPAEMVTSSRVFPEPFVNLYHTGEVTGQLDETLTRLHVMYRDEGSRNLKLASALFPKVVYGIIAFIVAWKVISFWGGYFQQINDAMKPLSGPGQ